MILVNRRIFSGVQLGRRLLVSKTLFQYSKASPRRLSPSEKPREVDSLEYKQKSKRVGQQLSKQAENDEEAEKDTGEEPFIQEVVLPCLASNKS
jgi:hypothetical protein